MTPTARMRTAYVASDLVLSFVGMVVYSVIKYWIMPDGYEPRDLDEWLLHDGNILLGNFLFPIMQVGLSALSGYYNNVLVKSRLDDLWNSGAVALVGTFIIYFLTLINDYIPGRIHTYELILFLWGCLFFPMYIGRTVLTLAQRNQLRRGHGCYRALIVGSQESSSRLRERMRPKSDRSIAMFNVLGRIDPDSTQSAIRREIAEKRPQALLVTPHPGGMQATVDMIERLYRTELDLYLTPELYQQITARPRMTNVVSEPLINITNANVPPSVANMKRVADVIVSSLALVVLSPVLAAIAVAIKRDSDGPVFYTQERVGYHKRKFRILKFRTMRSDAEAAGPALSVEDDPRITRVGRVLRKYRLDELPQFWNVIKGDMSLVGPRPEREYYVNQIVERVPYYSLIHQVRPGITSWGMVKYGYASNVDEMIERLAYDLIYIENVSFGVDLKILFHTVSTVVTGKGL